MPILDQYERPNEAPPSPMGEGEDQDYDDDFSEWETPEPEPTWKENIINNIL